MLPAIREQASDPATELRLPQRLIRILDGAPGMHQTDARLVLRVTSSRRRHPHAHAKVLQMCSKDEGPDCEADFMLRR
jgi:hypothetical protein